MPIVQLASFVLKKTWMLNEWLYDYELWTENNKDLEANRWNFFLLRENFFGEETILSVLFNFFGLLRLLVTFSSFLKFLVCSLTFELRSKLN